MLQHWFVAGPILGYAIIIRLTKTQYCMHTEQCLQLVNGGSDGTYKVAAADTQFTGYS